MYLVVWHFYREFGQLHKRTVCLLHIPTWWLLQVCGTLFEDTLGFRYVWKGDGCCFEVKVQRSLRIPRASMKFVAGLQDDASALTGGLATRFTKQFETLHHVLSTQNQQRLNQLDERKQLLTCCRASDFRISRYDLYRCP